MSYWQTLFTLAIVTWIVTRGIEGVTDHIIRTEAGKDVRILWKLYDTPVSLRDIYMIRIRGPLGYLVYCYVKYEFCDVQTSLLFDPPHVKINERWEHITGVGVMLKNVSYSDAGEYHISVENDILFDSTTVLYVLERPTRPTINVTEQPVAGDDVILVCTTAVQSLPVQYRRPSDIDVTWNMTRTNPGYVVSGNNLTIHDVKISDSGSKFSCTAREANSSLISEPSPEYILDVYFVEDIRFADGQNESVVIEGNSITKMCEADCNPLCMYMWKDGKGRQISRSPGLTLYNVSRHANNQFICQVTNPAGMLLKSFSLKVLYKPNIIRFDQFPGSVYEGNLSTIICEVDSYPPSETELYRYDHLLTSGGHEARQIWEKVNCSHNGEYECKTKNKIGMSSTTLAVDIKCSPRIDSSEVEMMIFENEVHTDMSIELNVMANPFPILADVQVETWGQGRPRGKSTAHVQILDKSVKINFKDISETDYGMHVVILKNELGQTYFLFEIKPPAPGFNSSVIALAVLFTLSLVGYLVLGTLYYVRRRSKRPSTPNDRPENVYVNTAFETNPPTGTNETDPDNPESHYDSLGDERETPQVYDAIKIDRPPSRVKGTPRV